MEFDLKDPTQAMIVELRTSNMERVRALRAQGFTVSENRSPVVMEFLLDLLAGASPERIEFERTHAQDVADQLDGIDKQILAEKFAVPAPTAPNLHSVQR